MRIHRTAGGPPALGLLVAVLVLLLSAAACTGDDPDADDPGGPGDPTLSWSPTGTMDPSSTGSGEPVDPVEPELPEVAREASEEGARAFIAYYWELINYAQVTGDVKALKAASGPNCDRCAAGVDAIRDVYRAGGYITEGRYTPTLLSLKRLSAGGADILAFEGKAEIVNVAHASVEGDGSREEFDASTVQYVVDVLWVKDRWRLDVMEVV